MNPVHMPRYCAVSSSLLIVLWGGCGSGAMNTADDGPTGAIAAEPMPRTPMDAGSEAPQRSAATTDAGSGTRANPAQAAAGNAGDARGAAAAGSSMMAGAAGTAGDSVGAAGSELDAGTASAAAGAGGVGGGGAMTNAGAEAGAGGVGGATTSAPKFEKTRCIDPDAIDTSTEVNFPCDDVDLWVALPEQCKDQRCGLIFNIHGGGMTDHATMDQATNMIALGHQAGFVVVHPHKGTWDVANDRSVVFEFLQQVIQAFDIDPARVHSTGYSQGGQLSWALGCEHADVVASIAPAEEINRVTDCWKPSKLPARELPILFAYGKRDSIGGGHDAAQQLASDIAAAWQMSGPETIAGSEDATHWRQRWTSATGNVFEFISQDYTSSGVGGILAGHCLPMNDGTTFVSCSTPVDYDWGQEVVSFFQAHPKP